MSFSEQALLMECTGEQLVGVLSLPEQARPLGLVIVVGGPQYRVGSHRQFVLLARSLAAAGYPVLRFDYRGMGDSTGDLRDFRQVDEDIATALDAFQSACPGVERIALWGLCDAASAALMYWYGSRDTRLAGLALLNPWVRSEASFARTQVKHYYAQRILQREFWAKLFSGKVGIFSALGSFLSSLRRSLAPAAPATPTAASLSFQQKMLAAIADFPGRVLVLLSGRDHTAQEFEEYLKSSSSPALLMRSGLDLNRLAEADHTFSSAPWKKAAEEQTLQWMLTLDSATSDITAI